MRRAARVDDNQKQIVAVFKAASVSVAVTSNQHSGYPDLTIGYLGYNILVEIKDGNKPPSARKLTPKQREFRANWQGEYRIVTSESDALALIKELQKRKGREGHDTDPATDR